jgi:hypothetical protein
MAEVTDPNGTGRTAELAWQIAQGARSGRFVI